MKQSAFWLFGQILKSGINDKEAIRYSVPVCDLRIFVLPAAVFNSFIGRFPFSVSIGGPIGFWSGPALVKPATKTIRKPLIIYFFGKRYATFLCVY